MRVVDVIQYLDETEVNTLKGLFDKDNIIYIVKKHSGASRYQSYYYRISVNADDLTRAKEITKQFNINHQISKNRCPNCKSVEFEEIENLNFFERLWYSGTTPVRCEKCKRRFVI